MSQRPRARDLGITIGRLEPGKFNAITDVPGVRVGHVTLIEGEGKLIPGKGPIRTGVTAIIISIALELQLASSIANSRTNRSVEILALERSNDSRIRLNGYKAQLLVFSSLSRAFCSTGSRITIQIGSNTPTGSVEFMFLL